MIENNEFQNLTEFLHGEFSKMNMTYGIQTPPKGYLDGIANSLLKRYRDVNALERKKLKFNIKVEWARYTMPHGFIWRLFHRRLWLKVKEQMDNPQEERLEDNVSAPEPDSLVPEVVVPPDTDSMSYPSTLDNHQI